MRLWPLVALAAWGGAMGVAWAGAAVAEVDYLEVEGKLSTGDFYRLVSCRALPGTPCTVDPVAWGPQRALRLTVGLGDPPPGYPRDLAHRVGRALDAAIVEINGAGAGLRLARVAADEPADVRLRLASVGEGDAIVGTGIAGVDGETIGAALVTVWWDESMRLSDAVIVVAADLAPADVGPVVLEELTQAMGLMTDIRDPYYEGLSVFSEDSNDATSLGPQDVEALRLHYPPGDP